MCQAFFFGAFEPLGRYGIRGLSSKHQTELEALHVTLVFPTPIWSIEFILASASPAFSRQRCRFAQVADIGPPRNSSSFVIMAHSIRAILFANAMAASILGLRARMRASHEFAAGGRTLSPEITAIAPMISKRRISRCPDLLVRASLGLPPLECCRGTRPSQVEKSRACRKVSIGGAKAAKAIEVMGPIPGIFCRRAENRDRLLAAAICASRSAIRRDRSLALRALQAVGFTITSIRDVTAIPHNGVRPSKRRRV